jgi:hypothetical protein
VQEAGNVVEVVLDVFGGLVEEVLFDEGEQVGVLAPLVELVSRTYVRDGPSSIASYPSHSLASKYQKNFLPYDFFHSTEEGEHVLEHWTFCTVWYPLWWVAKEDPGFQVHVANA